MRFHTIDLRRTTGITFFFCLDEVYAIHAHTSATPCAERTYERLPRRRQRTVTWLYLPLPSNDHVVAFGLQKQQSGSHRPAGIRFLVSSASNQNIPSCLTRLVSHKSSRRRHHWPSVLERGSGNCSEKSTAGGTHLRQRWHAAGLGNRGLFAESHQPANTPFLLPAARQTSFPGCLLLVGPVAECHTHPGLRRGRE